MAKLILSGLSQGALVLFVIAILIFALLAAAGGDAVTALRNDPRVSEETIAGWRRIYGLDRLPVLLTASTPRLVLALGVHPSTIGRDVIQMLRDEAREREAAVARIRRRFGYD